MMTRLTKIKYIIVFVILSFMTYSAYQAGYNSRVSYETRIIQKQTDRIEQLSKDISDNSDRVIRESTKNKNDILRFYIDNKTLYTVDKSGKCSPSKDFEKAYRELIK